VTGAAGPAGPPVRKMTGGAAGRTTGRTVRSEDERGEDERGVDERSEEAA
jgi:hypothetical protein